MAILDGVYLADGQLVVSPPDLTAFLACEHRSGLDRLVALGRLAAPAPDDPGLAVLSRPGGHHRAEVARCEAEGRHVVELAPPADRRPSPAALRQAEAATVAAMRDGADVIAGATFFDGRRYDRPGFLVRVDRPSDLGPWSYEVAGTGLARRAEPAAVLQLCADAEQVARIQGRWPDAVVVVVADGERHRHGLDDETVDRYRGADARFEASLASPPEELCYPEPVRHCAVCPWSARCDARRRADDHLRLVAGVRQETAELLRAAGITTAAELAASPLGRPVPGLEQSAADELRRQARLQLAARSSGGVRYELLDPAPGRGLALLPEPSSGDLFFDMEGDPWVGDGGREYLFGVTDVVGAYHGFWGHDHDGERRAFEALVDFVTTRLDTDPCLHVFHYASYEPDALVKLAERHGTRRADVDRLLAGGVLVDLYRVVREGVRVSQEGYGLKRLEPLYLAPRHGDITDGGASIVVYENWVDTGDPAILESIRAYNELDCRSTRGLRDWLQARRARRTTATSQ